jgi:hypothetical protein
MNGTIGFPAAGIDLQPVTHSLRPKHTTTECGVKVIIYPKGYAHGVTPQRSLPNDEPVLT